MLNDSCVQVLPPIVSRKNCSFPQERAIYCFNARPSHEFGRHKGFHQIAAKASGQISDSGRTDDLLLQFQFFQCGVSVEKV